MPVAFHHFACTVNLFRQRTFDDFCGPGPEAHACAFMANFALFLEQRDHWLFCVLIELGAVRAFEPADISPKLDRRHLHPKTKPEIRHLMLTGKTRGLDFPLDTTLAESTRNQNTGHLLQLSIHAVLERFSVDQFQLDPAILARRRVSERFVNAFVSVLE